jgi:hypothetical protein
LQDNLRKREEDHAQGHVTNVKAAHDIGEGNLKYRHGRVISLKWKQRSSGRTATVNHELEQGEPAKKRPFMRV